MLSVVPAYGSPAGGWLMGRERIMCSCEPCGGAKDVSDVIVHIQLRHISLAAEKCVLTHRFPKPHHGSCLRDHLNEDVRESAKACARLSEYLVVWGWGVER